MDIKNRFTGKVLFSVSGDTLFMADLSGADLSGADLSGTNLSGADLSGTNLSGADLSGANLWNTIGNNKEIKTFQFCIYTVNITKDIMQIGCENHTHQEWFDFNDDDINSLDTGNVIDLWNDYKDILFKIIELDKGDI